MPAAHAEQPFFAPDRACYIDTTGSVEYRDVPEDPEVWNCSRDMPDYTFERHIIRLSFDEKPANEEPLRYIGFQRLAFSKLHIEVFDEEGASVEATYTESDMQMGSRAWIAYLELPQGIAQPSHVVVTIDNSEYPEFVVDSYFAQEPLSKPLGTSDQILAAILCGILLAPILFDLGFYYTLRDRFPIFHALFCFSAFMHVLTLSGLALLLLDLSTNVHDSLESISLDFLTLAMALFIGSFLERQYLRVWQHRLLKALCVLPLVIAILAQWGTQLLPLELVEMAVFGLYPIFYGGLCYIIAVALISGSRSARFVTLAFVPLLLVELWVSMRRYFFDASTFNDAFWITNLSLLFEVSITAFAVADRFLALKRERDSAVNEARSMEALSERDPLTGLLNRRALQDRFEALRAEGFTALAIIDLDHFKSVNDTYGHHVGDEVLKVAAITLRSQQDEDLIAFRIGGEEFLIMLRGRAKQVRAERQRREIPRAIAAAIDLDRDVTASGGYLEVSAGALADTSFETLYERTDRLLYESKEGGRNRMTVEKVKIFQRRLGTRRSDAVAA